MLISRQASSNWVPAAHCSPAVDKTAPFSYVSSAQMVILCKYNSQYLLSNRWTWLGSLRARKGDIVYLVGGSKKN